MIYVPINAQKAVEQIFEILNSFGAFLFYFFKIRTSLWNSSKGSYLGRQVSSYLLN